tara:strand:+ start:773 stop:1126 length:354 start_codon:yes stop_codon:yes gene_type:complete
MQFLKRISPLFLSFTIIACCLTFQADTFSPTANTTTSWVITSFENTPNQSTYHINHRKAHSILENNFSIFNFKCCITHHKSLYAVQYKQHDNLLPIQLEFLKAIQQASNLEDDTFIG